jgi:hypothetical protein
MMIGNAAARSRNSTGIGTTVYLLSDWVLGWNQEIRFPEPFETLGVDPLPGNESHRRWGALELSDTIQIGRWYVHGFTSLRAAAAS